MFKANLATYPYVSPVNAYTENLGRAARSFIAALLAIDPAKAPSGAAATYTAGEDRMETVAKLEELAREFDEIMPSQAAELRYLISRE